MILDFISEVDLRQKLKSIWAESARLALAVSTSETFLTDEFGIVDHNPMVDN